MKTKVMYMAAVLGMAVSLGANAQTSGEKFNSYIEVSGYAEQEVAPDVFYMNIIIDEKDSKGRISLQSQETSMTQALQSLGIDTGSQLKRLSLSSSFYKKKDNLASGTYQLKLNRAEDVSRVWGALDNLGVSDVEFIKAEFSAIDSLRNEVRCRAVKNAREQAESMAGAVGQTIGKCFHIYAGQSGNAVLYAQPRMTKAVMMDSVNGLGFNEEESIEFSSIKVAVNVSAKFVLE